VVTSPWSPSSLTELGFSAIPVAYAKEKAPSWRRFLAWARAAGRDPLPATAVAAQRLLTDYLVSTTTTWQIKAAQSAVPATWALLNVAGADPSWRVDLHKKDLFGTAPLRRDTRFDPLWDAVAARRVAFAPLLGDLDSLTYMTLRRAAVAALKCSSALARHTEAAAMLGDFVALDDTRNVVPVPSPSDLGPCVALKLTAAKPDKASAAANVPVCAEFVVLADDDPATCSVRALLRYVSHDEYHRRRDEAEEDRLLLADRPVKGVFRAISADTVSRDLRATLTHMGVTQQRPAALARAAAANALLVAGLSDLQVRALGRWAPGSSAFERHYYRLGLDRIVNAGAAAEAASDDES
jgi:hypothetical protein